MASKTAHLPTLKTIHAIQNTFTVSLSAVSLGASVYTSFGEMIISKKNNNNAYAEFFFVFLTKRCHPHHWPLDAATTVTALQHICFHSAAHETGLKMIMNDDQSLQHVVLSNFVKCIKWQESSVHFVLATTKNRQQVYSDSSRVLRFFLVQGHVPVSWRVLPQFPHWSELSLLCYSVPLTHLQGFLQYRYNTYSINWFQVFICIL